MATFSSLPTELLQQVSSYLAPFDQIALSATSKRCYAKTKPHKPTKPLDQISQHIYLSLTVTTAASSTSNFVHHPMDVQLLLNNTYGRLSPNTKHHVFPPNPLFGHSANYGPPPSSKSVQHELLEPYFTGKGFPECTIAHHYFSAINAFADRVSEYAFGIDFNELIEWAYVRIEAQRCSRWLEENLATTENAESAVP